MNALLSTDRGSSACIGQEDVEIVYRGYIINKIRRHDDRDLSIIGRYFESTRGVDGRNFLHFAARHGRDGLDHVLENVKIIHLSTSYHMATKALRIVLVMKARHFSCLPRTVVISPQSNC